MSKVIDTYRNVRHVIRERAALRACLGTFAGLQAVAEHMQAHYDNAINVDEATALRLIDAGMEVMSARQSCPVA